MTTKKKMGLHLVRGKSKEYEVVTIYTLDGYTFVFSLNDYEMWESEDWLEFRKKDKSVMECFPVNNLSRVTFVSKGGQPVIVGPKLEPVA